MPIDFSFANGSSDGVQNSNNPFNPLEDGDDETGEKKDNSPSPTGLRLLNGEEGKGVAAKDPGGSNVPLITRLLKSLLLLVS